jgi:DNA helicase HerA-like ATPase
MDLLESYVDVPPRPAPVQRNGKTEKVPAPKQKTYTPRQPGDQLDFLRGEPGILTIVDLTDPVVDPDAACVLFDICLSIFVSQTPCGKIIALDEAHNYMGETNAAAAQFTERLLQTIREQRHQGARVVIATQEPSINPRLLDLCNITMVHRCTSPAWFAVLKAHIAALRGMDDQAVFEQIVRLKVGESLRRQRRRTRL